MVTNTFLAYALGFGSGMFVLLCVMVALRFQRVSGYKVSYMGHWVVAGTAENAHRAFAGLYPDVFTKEYVTCTPVQIRVLIPLARTLSNHADARDVSTFFRKLGKSGAFGKPAYGRI